MAPLMTQSSLLESALARIDELEIRSAFLEDSLESLNQQLCDLSQEFTLAKQAAQHLYRRLEQLQDNQGAVKDASEEAPPPHY